MAGAEWDFCPPARPPGTGGPATDDGTASWAPQAVGPSPVSPGCRQDELLRGKTVPGGADRSPRIRSRRCGPGNQHGRPREPGERRGAGRAAGEGRVPAPGTARAGVSGRGGGEVTSVSRRSGACGPRGRDERAEARRPQESRRPPAQPEDPRRPPVPAAPLGGHRGVLSAEGLGVRGELARHRGGHGAGAQAGRCP